MSEGRIIVNKHFSNSSAITEDVFTKKSNQLREGEIVISNDPEEPGIFIMTHNSGNTPGEVVNLNSAKNVKLSQDYSEPGEASEVQSGDTIDTAVGKLSKQIKDVAENAMPNIGGGLKIEVSAGTKILSVKYDGETIVIGPNGELKAVNGGGGEAKLQYSSVETHTTPFIGLDGDEHPAGIYLVLGFGPDGGTITYSYSDISALVNIDDVYLTEEEYQELVDEGTVDPNVTYYTYED